MFPSSSLLQHPASAGLSAGPNARASHISGVSGPPPAPAHFQLPLLRAPLTNERSVASAGERLGPGLVGCESLASVPRACHLAAPQAGHLATSPSSSKGQPPPAEQSPSKKRAFAAAAAAAAAAGAETVSSDASRARWQHVPGSSRLHTDSWQKSRESRDAGEAEEASRRGAEEGGSFSGRAGRGAEEAGADSKARQGEERPPPAAQHSVRHSHKGSRGEPSRPGGSSSSSSSNCRSSSGGGWERGRSSSGSSGSSSSESYGIGDASVGESGAGQARSDGKGQEKEGEGGGERDGEGAGRQREGKSAKEEEEEEEGLWGALTKKMGVPPGEGLLSLAPKLRSLGRSGSGSVFSMAWLMDAAEPAVSLYNKAFPTGPLQDARTSAKWLVDVAQSMRRTTAGMERWGIGDLTLGLYLLSLRHAAEEACDIIGNEVVTDRAVVKDMLYHFELARGAACRDSASLARTTMLRQSRIVKHVPEAGVMQPAYFVAVDDRTKLVVLSVRGTRTAGDLMTNLASHSARIVADPSSTGQVASFEGLETEADVPPSEEEPGRSGGSGKKSALPKARTSEGAAARGPPAAGAGAGAENRGGGGKGSRSSGEEMTGGDKKESWWNGQVESEPEPGPREEEEEGRAMVGASDAEGVDEETLRRAYGHYGIARAAKWLVDNESALLRELLAAHPGYEMRLVGHSLGGAVASVLAMMLVRDAPRLLGVAPEAVRCVGFSTPPCVSRELAVASSGFISTLVLQDDFVPRMSATAFDRLRTEILLTDWSASLKEGVVRAELVDRVTSTFAALASWRGSEGRGEKEDGSKPQSGSLHREGTWRACGPLGEGAAGKGKAGGEAQAVSEARGSPGDAERAALGNDEARDEKARAEAHRGELQRAAMDAERPISLFTPGMLFHLVSRVPDCSLVAAHGVAHQECRSNQADGKALKDLRTYVLLTGPPEARFERLVLSESMLSDHRCGNIYAALREALKTL